MKAVKIIKAGQAAVVSAPLPRLRPGYVMVKTQAVALNPTDWKHIDWMPTPSATVGCDYAGIIEKIGEGVDPSLLLKPGDRVAGFVHGGNSVEVEDGAFAEYVVAKAGLCIKIPNAMGWEDAATLGVGMVTVGQGLYQSMGLPLPKAGTEKERILVYGGSTATGAYAIQFAKMSGFEVVTTCSPRNFDYVRSLGADHIFDYSSPDCGKQIREVTKDSLFYAFDTISEPGSAQICADALASEGASAGKKPFYGCILNIKSPRADVQSAYTLGYTAVGEGFKMRGMELEPRPRDYEFAVGFMRVVERLLADGSFRVHRTDVREGGLEGVLDGLNDLREGKVSGRKIVYRVGEGKV
ncbi:putative zinc-binding oxidoreductase ToxD [Lepidopterella palustris CBS 459.81]|uniref:Putative zinc-binding oxidoreductase ToxD n=1 Tax=Lepidopterella palustris CBS 459.81 TaxID=1314670 RepID=A0A8E2JGG7_9PEZI|nr:putative zinc-binding oxidoreductase ToxD [Lepidopterella palustris CBS 459.81]